MEYNQWKSRIILVTHKKKKQWKADNVLDRSSPPERILQGTRAEKKKKKPVTAIPSQSSNRHRHTHT